MQAELKWRKSFRGADILGRKLHVFICALAFVLMAIGHAHYADAASTTPIFQTAGHSTCNEGTGGAVGFAPHCGQHNACGQLLLAQSDEMAEPKRASTSSIEPDIDLPDHPIAPPYRPPKFASAASAIAA